MKKLFILFLLWTSCALGTFAQSNMTDNQVATLIQQEVKKGSSQAQIVTKLMQNGVDINQIRRVRKKLERVTQGSGMGTVKSNDGNVNRMRDNNAVLPDNYKHAGQHQNSEKFTTDRIQSHNKWQEKYDENSQDFQNIQSEVALITPQDSLLLLRKLLAEQEKKKHKVFGRDIFSNKDMTFDPVMNIATPQNYKLGPGDAVIIEIYGASQKSIPTTVSPDGDVVIEGYGPIQVSGLTVQQANNKIRAKLGARYQSSHIKISLGQTRSISVNVMGEVKTPGTYTLSAFATVFNALYMAGGTNNLGTLRNIRIYRHNKLVSVCDIYDYILNGKMTGNIRLADGDVIIVGPYDCLVNITGKVKRPMYYEMKRDESVGTLLKYAGGFTGDAYKKAVRVNRKTGKERAVYNVEEFDMNNFHIADGDSVSVDSILPRYQNTVEIKGAVFRPGNYQLGNGITSVRTLIQHAEGLKENAFTNRAVIHRMKPDRTLKVISVDVKGVMDGKIADVPLQENDIVFIPYNQDAMDPPTLTIYGEVHYPGVYKYADNETLEDLVLQAGGLMDAASTVKVDVARRIKNQNATAPDSVIAKAYSFALKDGFVVDGEPGFVLMPYDKIYVRKSPAYNEQKNVSVEGEVIFPGEYTLTKRNLRLTDLLKMAGGVTDLAYIKGARLERVPNEVEKMRMKAALKMQEEQLQQELLNLAASSNNSGSIQQLNQKASNTQLQKFEIPQTFPVGIELDKALSNPKSDANIILREGDKLILPQYTATVKINGAVMYPNTVSYQKGKNAKYYINVAGGFSPNAHKSKAFVIYMNGMVDKVSHGAKIEPGCEIIIPAKFKRKMSLAETMSLGSSMSSIAAMLATMANIVK